MIPNFPSSLVCQNSQCLFPYNRQIRAHAQWRQVLPSNQWALSLHEAFHPCLTRAAQYTADFLGSQFCPLFSHLMFGMTCKKYLTTGTRQNQSISKCPCSSIRNNSENLSCTPLKKLYLSDHCHLEQILYCVIDV